MTRRKGGKGGCGQNVLYETRVVAAMILETAARGLRVDQRDSSIYCSPAMCKCDLCPSVCLPVKPSATWSLLSLLMPNQLGKFAVCNRTGGWGGGESHGCVCPGKSEGRL